jgi:GMP synthase-like glutamine amidotransferase
MGSSRGEKHDMKLHYIQHVPFEGIANIRDWAENRSWPISGTHIYRGESLPAPDDIDWLIVMGGPMNIYEEKEYPWLAAEKKFIEAVVGKNKIVIGICLGAQLIADVLGGRVSRNRDKEIGWLPVRLTPEGIASTPFCGFPEQFTAFHWHGDTFSLPPGAIMLAESRACPAQAFSFNDQRVLALQFHLESSGHSIRSLIENCSDELVEGEYIQSAVEILGKEEYFSTVRASMRLMLDNMTTVAV